MTIMDFIWAGIGVFVLTLLLLLPDIFSRKAKKQENKNYYRPYQY